MTCEDVYDNAAWCSLCEAPHSPCEEDELRYVCFACGELIEDLDIPLNDDGTAYHAHCPPTPSHFMRQEPS